MKFKSFIILLVAVNANLIQNGGFEDNSNTYCKSEWCSFLSSDLSAIHPWRLLQGSSYEINQGPFKAFNGSWSMDLSSDSPYTIAQTVNLTVGRDYCLTYHLMENNGGGIANHTGYVTATGASIQDFWHQNSVFGDIWLTKYFYFTATSAATEIILGSTTSGGYGPVIDEISLVALLTSNTYLPVPSLTKTNLIVNGDFEDHQELHCGGDWCFYSDNSVIAPWRLVQGTSFEIDKGPFKAFSGTWSMDLSSDSPYTIAQTVNTTVGLDYSLSYHLMENNSGDNTNHTGYVSATGAIVENFWYRGEFNARHANAVHGGNWLYRTYNFTATSALTEIEFGSTTAGGFGPVIDDVVLVALPTTSSYPIVKCVVKSY